MDKSEKTAAKYLVGTCTAMCPKEEMLLREKERLLHAYEMKTGTENDRYPQADPDKTVKAFRRSAAGNKMDRSELRPFPVLLKTIQYLFTEIFPRQSDDPLKVYNFMFDRLRSVRQDMVIQNLTAFECVYILEPITRFHIYFGYILVGEKGLDFDPFINNTHLQECLKRLLVCYDESETDIVNSLSQLSVSTNYYKNRQEIEAAYLLFNLSHIEAMTRGAKLTEAYLKKEILELSFAWYLKNFVRAFRLLKHLSPLLLCVFSSSLPEIRKQSLEAFSQAFNSPNSAYPVSHLRNLLLYEDESELIEDCKHFNIKVTDNNVNFSKKEFNTSAKSKKFKRLSWIDELLLKSDLVKMLCFGFE
ncbi:UNVERIFIED_CONTAM: hypothetical protein PYX00_002802 [Menopon gallinae]|uniref:SAC3/GANP/THP3 conserved domain-containing protein n=1 Tax=Menopon gallinae TaxID=328185 RepID=A0AAW2HXM3_9NEOP